MLAAVIVLAWGMSVSGAYAAAQTSEAKVLIVYSQNRLLPGNIDFDRGFNEASKDGVTRDVHFFAEFLDSPESAGDVFESRTAAYLKEKYAGRPPQVIVGAGAGALAFLLRRRAEMFPGVPIVYGGVDRRVLKTLALPADVIGVPVDYDIRGTIELARRLQPDARRLVVVTGASNWDHQRQMDIRADLENLRSGLPVEYLAGLPGSDLGARLAKLTRDTIVFTPGYFADGAGRSVNPRDSVTMMAGASGAPLYVLYSSQIGTGAVGGRMPAFSQMGRAARIIVDGLLEGASASSIAIPAAIPSQVQLDWRQVRKWNIAADHIPPSAVIQFREPTFWEAYHKQAIIAAAVMSAQAVLIGALLFERRRRRSTAAALVESEERVRLAADAARLTTFSWDFARDRSAANAGLRERADPPQRTAESFEHILQTVHPADRERLGLAAHRAAANHTELDVEFRARQPDGEIRWYAARGQRTATDSDTLTGVKMDITARKTAELQAEADRAALTHLSRVATMGQMSAAIAHQLNQPLAAILGNAETARKMLGRKDASIEDLREILDDIVAEDNRAAEVIRRLGALYKRGEIELSELDLNDLVRETLNLLRAELTMRKVSPVLELAASLPAVRGSRVHLQQVLLNLVLNATDAMTAVDPGRRTVVVRTSSEAEHARVCIVDRGTGIAAGDLPRVFDAFWTTKANGVGVGLAICKAIINSHRGTLAAENNPEGGAAFCFTLPLAGSA
ncbi:MAG: Sensor histidine kinase TmoS [Accumulibacter sp.]|mgnify:FL=1|jgi:signal transduction histidine kinase|uniref:sensor histidine kinase n=1 Tax=Accumulibacter sp. TaxID=2053492 RepID=UPI0012041DA4|nr:ATP-binding protein [Accumulibacter sp.]QKS27526.1 MAG: PAS domain-containing protein [Candidatus Accumulibacter similis]TLD46641.1 MAG: Sensor histidine kinase TmoS [Accumulibacter sp.]